MGKLVLMKMFEFDRLPLEMNREIWGYVEAEHKKRVKRLMRAVLRDLRQAVGIVRLQLERDWSGQEWWDNNIYVKVKDRAVWLLHVKDVPIDMAALTGAFGLDQFIYGCY